MMLSPIPSTDDLSTLAQASVAPSQGTSFDDLLTAARRAGNGEAEVRQTAEQLVATAFIAPVLKQIRESSQAEPPFAPTPAEKQFGSILDTRTAEEIVRSANLPIVDRLTQTFLELGARVRQAAPALGENGVIG